MSIFSRKKIYPERVRIYVGRIGSLKKVINNISSILKLDKNEKSYIQHRLSTGGTDIRLYCSMKEFSRLEKVSKKIGISLRHLYHRRMEGNELRRLE